MGSSCASAVYTMLSLVKYTVYTTKTFPPTYVFANFAVSKLIIIICPSGIETHTHSKKEEEKKAEQIHGGCDNTDVERIYM